MPATSAYARRGWYRKSCDVSVRRLTFCDLTLCQCRRATLAMGVRDGEAAVTSRVSGMWNSFPSLRISGMFPDRVVRRLIGALVLGLGLTGAPQAYGAEHVALLIGDRNYAQLPRLINPVNNATDVSQSLQRVGFQVTIVKDASLEQLRVALLAFARELLESCATAYDSVPIGR
jgi:hypothetical protein